MGNQTSDEIIQEYLEEYFLIQGDLMEAKSTEEFYQGVSDLEFVHDMIDIWKELRLKLYAS